MRTMSCSRSRAHDDEVLWTQSWTREPVVIVSLDDYQSMYLMRSSENTRRLAGAIVAGKLYVRRAHVATALQTAARPVDLRRRSSALGRANGSRRH